MHELEDTIFKYRMEWLKYHNADDELGSRTMGKLIQINLQIGNKF